MVGLLVWGAGLVGVGIGLEDRCLQVAVDEGYGASSQSSSVWPPRFSCSLSGPESSSAPEQVEVEQHGAALVRSGWVLGFPVGWVVLGGAILRRPSDRVRVRQRAHLYG